MTKRTEELSAAEIFRICRNMMYQTAYGVLHNREDAEDAVADAMEKICRNLGKFQNRDEAEWKLLVKICVKNIAIDRYRKKRRDSADSIEEMEREIPDESAADETDGDFGSLQQYVDRLSEDHRNVLILKYAEEMKNREIAQLLGIPEATVATRLLRAKLQLKKLYGKDGRTDESK
ncbi:MAG: sigma-70 family RNA polymerase sigma factor [Clostridia bacterium]|nr:sigma-70 family RNA polymerase sigma factor [Clostridia bacterium]